MRFLILFIFLSLNSVLVEASNIKNLIINEEPRKYDDLSFLDDQNRLLKLDDYKGSLIP